MFCHAHLRNKLGFQLLLAKHPTKNIYEVKSEVVLAYAVCYQYIWKIVPNIVKHVLPAQRHACSILFTIFFLADLTSEAVACMVKLYFKDDF